MAKFRKEGGKETPAISTASLPDIVFMLLFFFMVSTTMREVLVMVDNGMPEAKEISKLEKKSLVSNIFIGKPKDQYVATYGSEPRIQLNDKLANVSEISSFVAAEQETRKEEERNMITNNLKVMAIRSVRAALPEPSSIGQKLKLSSASSSAIR